MLDSFPKTHNSNFLHKSLLREKLRRFSSTSAALVYAAPANAPGIFWQETIPFSLLTIYL